MRGPMPAWLATASSARFARPTGFARWAVLASIVLAAGGAGLAGWVSGGTPVPRSLIPVPVPPDTVTVYGPRRFETPTGSPAHHVERFGLAPAPGQRYVLRVVNGNADGSGRVTGGAVTLNSAELVSAAEPPAGGA